MTRVVGFEGPCAVAKRRTPLNSGLLVSTLTLAGVVLSACGPTAANPAEPPPPKVTVAPALSRDVTEWDEFTGRLEAVTTVELRPRVSGYIDAVRFVEGAMVRRGDLLFEIDARAFQAEVDRLRAELSRARATVQRAGSELQRAERLGRENAMSREERERRASFERESAAQVGSVEAALRAAELNLEWTRVTAPIGGRVGRAIVKQGNLVSSGPSDATLLTTIVSLDPIYASFDADEQTFLRYLALTREGKRGSARQADFRIQLALGTDQGFPREGKLNFLDNRIDPATGTIRVRTIFRNADHSLTPGSFVRLRLPGAAAHRGVLIQDRAIGTDLDKRFVLVVTSDRVVQYRAVTLGPLIDGLRLVRKGVNPGDLLIVDGLQRVRPGAHVDIETVAMDDPATMTEVRPSPEGASEAGK